MLTLDTRHLASNALEIAFPELHPDVRLRISFQRTLRVPDDNRGYPLPPGLGALPLAHVDDYPTRLPPAWRGRGGVFLPMYQAEAMWLSFSSPRGYPFAVKVGAGKVNAITGEPWQDELDAAVQDYVVVPGQPWLDGFCVGKNRVRQFVAMPLGHGYTVEEQLTGDARHGGLQLVVYPLRPELHARVRRPSVLRLMGGLDGGIQACSNASDMGLAPGGLMEQALYADTRERSAWRTDVRARCFVHLLNSAQYAAATGKAPPTRPPTAADYTRAGLPWFDYFVDAPVLGGQARLKALDSVAALGVKKGEMPLPENDPVAPGNVVALGKRKPGKVRDGKA